MIGKIIDLFVEIFVSHRSCKAPLGKQQKWANKNKNYQYYCTNKSIQINVNGQQLCQGKPNQHINQAAAKEKDPTGAVANDAKIKYNIFKQQKIVKGAKENNETMDKSLDLEQQFNTSSQLQLVTPIPDTTETRLCQVEQHTTTGSTNNVVRPENQGVGKLLTEVEYINKANYEFDLYIIAPKHSGLLSAASLSGYMVSNVQMKEERHRGVDLNFKGSSAENQEAPFLATSAPLHLQDHKNCESNINSTLSPSPSKGIFFSMASSFVFGRRDMDPGNFGSTKLDNAMDGLLNDCPQPGSTSNNSGICNNFEPKSSIIRNDNIDKFQKNGLGFSSVTKYTVDSLSNEQKAAVDMSSEPIDSNLTRSRAHTQQFQRSRLRPYRQPQLANAIAKMAIQTV